MKELSIEQKEFLYDLIYDLADEYVFNKYNVCNIKDGKCFAAREDKVRLTYNNCCGECKHLDFKKGCTIRSLGCKLYVCYEAEIKLKEFSKKKTGCDNLLIDRLSSLTLLSSLMGLPRVCFHGKEILKEPHKAPIFII